MLTKSEVADAEIDFCKSLEDVVIVIEKLAQHCNSIQDLLGVVKLALTNEAQARFILSIVTEQAKPGKGK